MDDMAIEALYRIAYTQGQAAFQRGEQKEAVGSRYSEPLELEGWRNGWRDAYCASREDKWWDDASYAAWQARD